MKWILPIFVVLGLHSFKIIPYSVGIITEAKCDIAQSKAMSIIELLEGTRKYGHAIWINPTKVKANLITAKGAYNNVHERFNHWKDKADVLLSSSAAYAGRNFTAPVGLCIDKGNVSNKKIDSVMDALVIEKNGQISIYNIDSPFYVKGLSKRLSIKNSYDFIPFTNWALLHKASVFQTNLLAFDNQLKISSSGKIRRALRKFLVIVIDNKGIEQTVIIYIKRPEYLYDGSKKIFDYLQAKDYTLKAMVNLDTGVNDVLELKDSYENCNNRVIKGRTPINYATNLLVFYK